MYQITANNYTSTHNCAHSNRASDPPTQSIMFEGWGAQASRHLTVQVMWWSGRLASRMWQTAQGSFVFRLRCTEASMPAMVPAQFCILIISLFGYMECTPSMAACVRSTSKETWESLQDLTTTHNSTILSQFIHLEIYFTVYRSISFIVLHLWNACNSMQAKKAPPF